MDREKEMTEKEYIELLVDIGNDPQIKELCKPNIVEQFELKGWMVKRSLVAYVVFQKVLKEYKKDERRKK